MFTSIGDFVSLNKIEHLSDGTYHECCSRYQNKAGTVTTVVREFTKDGDAAPSACDLIIVLADVSILFRDYLCMPDGSWRNSYGCRAEKLASLFPLNCLICDYFPERTTIYLKLITNLS